ncbi:MAG: glycosyltransferase [Candidatus Krumholzibacteriia bacterium]
MRITFIGQDPSRRSICTGGDRYFHEIREAAAQCAELRDLLEPRLGVRSRRLALLRALHTLYLVLWYVIRLRRLRGALVVHDLTNRGHLGVVSWLARLLVGARPVLVVQGIYHHAGATRIRAWIERWAARVEVRAASLVVANSDATRDEMLRLGAKPSRVRVVTPGLDEIHRHRPRTRRVCPGPRALRVLFVGGQCKTVKGLDGLVEAVGRLATSHVQVTLVGERDDPTCGPYVDRLRRRARHLGIEAQLHFVGRVRDPVELRRVYLEHDLFVLPSWWEGYGVSVLEAMSAGLPAIVTRHGGAAGLVTHGVTGYHVEPGDAELLAETLQLFLDDPERGARMGLAAARSAERLAQSWDDTRASMLEALIETALRPDGLRARALRAAARAAARMLAARPTSRSRDARMHGAAGACRSSGAPAPAAAQQPADRRLCDGERVLVVEREGLGDALVLLPALRALLASHPRTRFDALASHASAEALALLPGIGKIRVASGAVRLLLEVARLRRQRYDWALVASPLLRSQILARLTGARRTAGFAVRGHAPLLDLTVLWREEEHQVDRRLDLAVALGAPPEQAVPRLDGCAIVEPAAHAAFDACAGSGPLVVLHARCNQICNLWPDERWIELARRLRSAAGVRLVLTGSAKEAASLAGVAAAVPGARLLAGRLSVSELLGLLQRADLLVTLDTGVMHLGSLAELPMVALLGGRNPAHEWIPRHSTARVLSHPVSCSPCRSEGCPLGTRDCMRGLSVDAVLGASLEALNLQHVHIGGS